MCAILVRREVIPVPPGQSPVHNLNNRNKSYYFNALARLPD